MYIKGTTRSLTPRDLNYLAKMQVVGKR